MDKTLWLTFLGHPVYSVNGSIKGCLMTCIHSVTQSQLQQTDARPDGRHSMRALPQIIKVRVIDSVTPFHIYVYVYLLIMQQVQDFVKFPISYSGGICPGASCCPIMIVVSGKSKVPKMPLDIMPANNWCTQWPVIATARVLAWWLALCMLITEAIQSHQSAHRL